MVTGEVLLNWLEGLIENSPERKSGEEDFVFFLCQIERTVNIEKKEERNALVWALGKWIDSGHNFKTPFAIEVVKKYSLHELEPNIFSLLKAVRKGTVFKPYYARFLEKALEEIKKMKP